MICEYDSRKVVLGQYSDSSSQLQGAIKIKTKDITPWLMYHLCVERETLYRGSHLIKQQDSFAHEATRQLNDMIRSIKKFRQTINEKISTE